MNTSENVLGTGKISRLMFSMGIPVMAAQLVNLLYNVIDRVYIGHIPGAGADALTGVGLAAPVITLVSAFASFAGAGGAPLAAMALGKGDRKKAEKIVGNAFFMIICFAIILMVVFQIVKEPFLYMFGASESTFVYAEQYLSIYLFGTVFVQIALGLNPYITAQGRAKTAMLSVFIGAVINMGLDPLFIYALNMGVRGAALATIISQCVSAIWILRFLVNKKTSLRLIKENIKPDFKIIGSVAALGISPFIMQSTESLIAVVMNRGFKMYGGDLYVGAYTVMQSVNLLITIPVQGFAQGVQPIISYNYGAGNIARVKKTFYSLLVIMVGVTSLITATVMAAPEMYGAVFSDNQELIALVVKIMPVFFAGFLIFGVQLACQQAFMALGQAKLSLFFAMLRKIILLTPLVIVLPMVLSSNQVRGVYFAEPISDVISAVCCGTVFALSFKKILEKRKT